ncbi:Acyl-CoA dehydrogenase; probable dibenzothiophene desulfurization enzyme [Devosia sp. DBB001]|nr:Acyl-CoA dehydrogenase; probable dibenzothiophene desulfurization enzyme [Devosia sp. DBB001]
MTAIARISRATPPLSELLASAQPLADEIAVGAAKRDIERELPFEAFARFKASGLGALRVPVALGGPGGSITDLIEVIATIGGADSNVAHALRSHFNFTEGLVLDPDGPRAREHLQHVLDGKLFGGAHTEQGGPKPGEINTRLSRDGDRYRLNGRKWYATGTAFADYASFSAKTAEGEFFAALIPTDRPGITILDDWDGMGQKLTASGGVLLENVEVLPSELSQRAMSTRVGRHTSTLRQLHLAASAGGAVRAALREGTEYVRKQARAAQHSPAATAREDHFVQKVVGEIAARSFAIDALLRESARALDRTVEAFASDDEARIEASLIESSLATSNTQLILAELGLKAAEQIFELGGGSATSRKYSFDRHWRNIRTVLNHNPLLHKARVLGDYHLNGTTTHLEEGKVF